MKSINQAIRARRPLVVGGVVAAILVLLTVAYVFWSGHMWSQYQASYENWNQETRSKAEELLVPQLTKSDRLTQFTQLATSIDREKDTRCNVNSLVAWQQFAESNKQKQEECRRVATTLIEFGRQLQEVIAYLEDESELTAILKDATKTSNKLPQAQWAEQADTWSTVEKVVQTLDVTPAFTEVKVVAVTKVSSVEVAWKKVVAADKAKSETQYVDAEKELTQAYAGLKDIGEKGADRFGEIVADAQGAYDRAFAN